MAVSRRLRFEILRRDNMTCRYCGESAPNVTLTVDHVVPVALGGADDPSNLVTACKDCNAGKTSVAPADALVADVSQVNANWQAALTMARQQLAAGATDEASVDLEWFDERWTTWKYDRELEVRRPSNWRSSVRAFLNAGLTIDMVVERIPLAMTAGIDDRWTYFCGCCWRSVREVQALAVTIMGEVTEQDEIDADTELRERRAQESCLDEALTIGDILRRAAEV